MKHRPELDGLRGIAIAGVLLQHSSLAPGGHYGVVLFFVLSGYLITGLLVAEHDRKGRVSLRSFYLRRAARLWPALLAVLAGLTLILVTVHHTTHLTAWLVAAGTYTSNIAMRIFGADAFNPVNWSWSLALEEQFYLLWPPVLVLCLRRGVDRRKIGRWLLVVAVVVEVLRLIEPGRSVSVSTAPFAPELRGDALLIGSAVALIEWRGHWAWPASLVFAGLTFYSATPLFTLRVGLLLATLAAAVIVAEANVTALARGLSLRPLVYLGTISYSLYLWNSALGALWWLGPTGGPPRGWWLPAWLVLAVALAHFSTKYVETPIRRWARSRETDKSQPGAEAVIGGHVQAYAAVLVDAQVHVVAGHQ